MSPTPLLLVCLLIATALGAAMGVCAWHLLLTRRHKREVDAFEASPAVVELVDRNRSLLTVTRDQRRRIELLESEVLSLEERHMKLQRDLASSRAARRQLLDSVPVLNRRVADD